MYKYGIWHPTGISPENIQDKFITGRNKFYCHLVIAGRVSILSGSLTNIANNNVTWHGGSTIVWISINVVICCNITQYYQNYSICNRIWMVENITQCRIDAI